MRIKSFAAAVMLGVSAVGLSACATGFPAKVSRYQAMPAPQGQSFVVVPMNAANSGSLEFSRYAEQVAAHMQALGYARAPSINQATMVVRLGYGVDDGTREYVSDPFYYSRRYDPFYHGYRPYYSRYRYYGPRSPFYWGWDDPLWYGPYGGYGTPVRSYTSYKSELNLDIRRKADNAALFEGKAKARSRTDNLGTLVPNLIEAMFTGFPGNSGEEIRITVPAERTAKRN